MLKNLCEIPSPSGAEEQMKDFIVSEASKYADLFFEDAFGNLVFVKKGTGERICIECGIDEPFLMVSEQSGETLRFSAPPHIKASVFADKDIFFADGNSVFVESEKENADDYKVTDLYAKTKTERKTGECASMLPCFKTDGEEYSALNIKYKLPAFALINALKAIKGNTSELYFVFSVQKCLAARGVRALMQSGIYFDKVLSVNCIEETEENAEGVVVMAIEKSCVSTPEIRKGILRLAEEKKIPVRVGFTLENFSMKLYITEGQGTPCGLLCIPLKENSVKINNVKAAADLIAAMCEE